MADKLTEIGGHAHPDPRRVTLLGVFLSFAGVGLFAYDWALRYLRSHVHARADMVLWNSLNAMVIP